MAEDPRIFQARTTRRLAQRFLALAKGEARSRSIAQSLRLVPLGLDRFAIESPYYWAVYYHDGRGPIRARPGHKLVYFRNIDQDPRVPNRRYPVREADIVRLTKAQFYRFLADPSKGMIVRDSVGPSAGDPFLERAGRRFKRVAGRIAAGEFSTHVRRVLERRLNLQITTGIVL